MMRSLKSLWTYYFLYYSTNGENTMSKFSSQCPCGICRKWFLPEGTIKQCFNAEPVFDLIQVNGCALGHWILWYRLRLSDNAKGFLISEPEAFTTVGSQCVVTIAAVEFEIGAHVLTHLNLIIAVITAGFECILDKNLLDKMADRIDKIVVEKEDSVRIYSLCANCEREIRVIGKGKVSKNEDVYII